MPDVRRLTPLVSVDAIEPCIPFWTEALGFEKGPAVPGESGLGFLILNRGPAQLMYQTVASIEDDLPALAEEMSGQTNMLFIEVTDLDGFIERLDAVSAPVVVPRRKTFYGSDEIFVRAPCGTIVGLAEFANEESDTA